MPASVVSAREFQVPLNRFPGLWSRPSRPVSCKIAKQTHWGRIARIHSDGSGDLFGSQPNREIVDPCICALGFSVKKLQRCPRVGTFQNKGLHEHDSAWNSSIYFSPRRGQPEN